MSKCFVVSFGWRPSTWLLSHLNILISSCDAINQLHEATRCKNMNSVNSPTSYVFNLFVPHIRQSCVAAVAWWLETIHDWSRTSNGTPGDVTRAARLRRPCALKYYPLVFNETYSYTGTYKRRGNKTNHDFEKRSFFQSNTNGWIGISLDQSSTAVHYSPSLWQNPWQQKRWRSTSNTFLF